jgi:hypothetical protein
MASYYALNLQNLYVQAQDRSHVIQAANIPWHMTSFCGSLILKAPENSRYPHPGCHDQPRAGAQSEGVGSGPLHSKPV